MSLYEEKGEVKSKAITDDIIPNQSYQEVSEQLATLMDYSDSVIYLTEDINDNTLIDFMIRVRAILNNRTLEQKDEPINLIINSNGGDIHNMLGIIDYIESLSVKVRAFSAAAIILACGTGTRMMSKRSSIMFHQSSSFLDGKMSDLESYLTNVKKLETNVYNLLADKTNKDAKWWKDQMKSDFYIPADDLVEYGVIDQII